MIERRVMVVGTSMGKTDALVIRLAAAGLLSTGMSLERHLSEDPEFGLISGPAVDLFDEQAILRAARRLGKPAPRPVYRNRFLNPVEKAEVIHPEVPLTKRQRRRLKGKK